MAQADDARLPAWDGAAIKRLVEARLGGAQIIVVWNRQPHSHVWRNGAIDVEPAPGGMVTALEPIVRACGGTWIAHGSGSADRAVVDGAQRWRATAKTGSYQLRRVWLSKPQQRGHGDFFSNAGLWPICHLANVRPSFTQPDWAHYVDVNRLFADAVVRETQRPDPVVLVQDYHLALVPAMVRELLPRATLVSFWHISWTHYEQMRQCPWLAEIVAGLQGSDIVGFQTAQHAAHFKAAARAVGAVDARSFESAVRVYPISIAWPSSRHTDPTSTLVQTQARDLERARWNVPAAGKLVVGVDRLDPTKGLVQRVHAIKALLESQPAWQGLLRFVQVAAPTRVGVAGYAALHQLLKGEVQRVNARYASAGWEPITLLDHAQDRERVNALYRASDVCLVTSLHDGMNLVSKEFVAARDDEQGVLVLSKFAGSACELGQALLVNPHEPRSVAQTLHEALTLPALEQRSRMRALRATVKSNNVFRWGAHMLTDALALRESRAAA